MIWRSFTLTVLSATAVQSQILMEQPPGQQQQQQVPIESQQQPRIEARQQGGLANLELANPSQFYL